MLCRPRSPPGGAAEPTGAPGLPVSYRGGPTTTECSRQPLHPTHPNHRIDPQGTDARREVPKGTEARRNSGAEAREFSYVGVSVVWPLDVSASCRLDSRRVAFPHFAR